MTRVSASLLRRRKPKLPTLGPAVSPEWAKGLRRESRTRLLRWGLHGVVLLVLVGLPYVRGVLRAHELQELHARAAACMFGGARSNDPSGRFAAMVLRREPDWPTRCEPSVRALAREPARFVFPSVKTAEVDVQKAAQLTLAELENLAAARSPGASIPLRPLWGLELLRNAVAAHADAAGISTSNAGAATAPRDASPTPSLLDIDAAPDATVKLWGAATDLHVIALDGRGISYVGLQPENTTRARLPRRGSLRSAVLQDRAAYLVWSTAPDNCGAIRCAEKSTGLAPVPLPLTKLPEPRWIAAHPFGSPERSIAWHGARTWLAAAQLDGTARLVEIEALPAVADPEAAPLEPAATLTRDARELVVFTESSGALGAFALEIGADGRQRVMQYREQERAWPILQLPAAWRSAWLRTCLATNDGGLDVRYFVLGSEDQALFGFVREGATTTWPVLDAAIPAPEKADRTPAVAIACSATHGVTAAFLEAGALDSVTCTPGTTACVPRTVAELATSVDLAYTPDGIVIAYSAAPEQPQVRVGRIGFGNESAVVTSVPGPCWERWGGMCGEPTLAWAGPRLVLAARSGASLMALESSDAGRSWSALSATNLVKPPDPHALPRAGMP